MPSVKVYNMEGEETGTLKLPEKVFGVPMNKDLLHQAIRMYQANKRKSTAHTKTRAEVSGGGRKPWRQKHTGRARHGSRRSPIWKGGGITFGPRSERNWKLQMPEKMRRKALFVALSAKTRDNEIVLLDELKLGGGKTKDFKERMKQFALHAPFPELGAKGGRSLIVLPKKEETLSRAARNLSLLAVELAQNLNPLKVLSCKYLVLPKEGVAVIEKTFVK